MSSQEPSLLTSVAAFPGAVAEEDANPTHAPVRAMLRGRVRIEHAAIASIALLSLCLGLFRINQLGTANPYYAAAVKSMTESWHAFLFVSFDRIGFVSVGKPPLGLWDQALLADLLGFHGWVIILPQVLALTASVIVLYHLVTGIFGTMAGLAAALMLALTPISVAAARNNTSDSMLVFVLLLATWAVLTAIARESVWRFTFGMILVGIGFNVKMMEAWLILPALLAAWTLSPSTRTRRHRIANRLAGLVFGAVALLAVSFSWMTFVQLTPPDQRPWIDSTATNNVFSLAFGYNGLARLLPSGWSIFGLHNAASSSPVTDVLSGGQNEASTQGLFRLLSPQLGAQIGWLLPMAVIGLVASWGVRRWWMLDARRTSLVIWGGWLFTVAGFFSVAGFFHRYYLVMLAPAIAALAGIGMATIWNARASAPRLLWLLLIWVGCTVAIQIHLLNRFPTWRHRLEPALIVGVALLSLGILAIIRRKDLRERWSPLGSAVIGLAIGVVLLAPGTWAMITSVDAATGSPNPAAGPSAPANAFTAARLEAVVTNAALSHAPAKNRGAVTPSQAELTTWLVTHQGLYPYLVATRWAHDSWTMILATGDPVMSLGGFTGRDPILDPASFAHLVAAGEVRYAWGNYGHKITGRAPRTVDEWVATNCSVVPAGDVASHASTEKMAWGAAKLYDCSKAARRATQTPRPAPSKMDSTPSQSSSHAIVDATPTAQQGENQMRTATVQSDPGTFAPASTGAAARSTDASSDDSEQIR